MLWEGEGARDRRGRGGRASGGGGVVREPWRGAWGRRARQLRDGVQDHLALQVAARGGNVVGEVEGGGWAGPGVLLRALLNGQQLGERFAFLIELGVTVSSSVSVVAPAPRTPVAATHQVVCRGADRKARHACLVFDSVIASSLDIIFAESISAVSSGSPSVTVSIGTLSGRD